jgi:MOSC domain-containing protein
MAATVAQIFYYPVKGCAAVPAARATVTAAGLAHDRTFMIVDSGGDFRSQRRDPRMVLIRPGISADGARLTLSGAGGHIEVAVDSSGTARPVTMFGRPLRGIDQGDAVAAWLTGELGTDCRLVRVPADNDRVTGGRVAGTAAYADAAPVNVLSTASLDQLGRRIGERLPVRRFRPNILVTGWDEPHTEDTADRIAVGEAVLAFAKRAGRCVVTKVDPDTGVAEGPDPLRALAGYRNIDGALAFSANFAVVRGGRIAVGDAVELIPEYESASPSAG